MKNPLYKRLKRELAHDFVKYLVIFLFMALPIALCSGYMIGNDSMIRTYNEAVEKYDLEDGHFQTMFALSAENVAEMEKSENLTVYPLFYADRAAGEHTARIYRMSDRAEVDKWCVHGGEMPSSADEIALDRLYCENNGIALGDDFIVEGKKYTVSAFLSLFDYSCLYKNNTDTMFNARTFTVALVTDDAFDVYAANAVNNYAYRLENRLDEQAAHEKSVELRKNLYAFCLHNGNMLNDFLAKEDNQAITFSIEDIEGDLTMMLIFGILIVGGLAFVFALSVKSQIEREAGSIGTLKALGYKNGELMRHYLLLPVATTLLAGIVGNLLAYTALKEYLVQLYYHSYSLPVYTTYYNADALIYTTLIPMALVILINVVILARALSLPALNFLRGNLKKRKDKKVAQLNGKLPFMSRFRTRVVLQNKGTYLALFVGTFFACVILLFGLMMTPLLDHYKENVKASQLAAYQTILKADVPVTDEGAEKLLYTQVTYGNDDVIVYGVEKYGENSLYLQELTFTAGKAVINRSLSEKYALKTGADLATKEKFGDKEYRFSVGGVLPNDGSLIVFTDADRFRSLFAEGEYLVCYLSSEKLSLDEAYVYKTITLEDLVNVSNQLADSMGDVFLLFTVFSAVLFALLIFLLAKIVIEKNQNQISMMKIVGYKTSEINFAYNLPTGIMVMVSVIAGTLLSQFLIKALWNYFLRIKMRGWLSFYVAPYLYPLIAGIGLLCYLAVYFAESRKIAKIPLSLTLKAV